MATSVEDQVKQQVEFYFSASNFRRDKFMKEVAAKHDGYVPISVLLTFKKLQALTDDATVIQSALSASDVVELSEDLKSLRRKHPLPSEEEFDARTVILAGLGKDLPAIEDVQAALQAAAEGDEKIKTNLVQREKHRNEFSGICVIELADVESAKKVLANTDKIKLNGRTPVGISKPEFNQLTQEKQVDFKKAVRAMLVAKDLPEVDHEDLYSKVKALWAGNEVLKPRYRIFPEQKALYLHFTDPALAKTFNEKLQETPVKVNDQDVPFTLVEDPEEIAKRPHRVHKENNKRKNRSEGPQYALHMSNLGPKAYIEDLKNLLLQGGVLETSLPFIDYDGLDTANSVFKDAEAVFKKLQELEEPKINDRVVQFHLLPKGRELKLPINFDKGLIVHFSGVNGEISRDDIKDAINEKLEGGEGVEYIQYQIGDESGYLRTSSADVANNVVKIIGEGVQVGDKTLSTARVVDGEEEKQFWEAAQAARKKRRKVSRDNKMKSKRGRFR